MARIETYDIDSTISSSDFVIGTDGNANNRTKNFPIETLKDYILAGLEPEVGGTLKVTEAIGETGENTPQDVINALDPAYAVAPYEIVIVTTDNAEKYLFKKNNDTFGVGETQTVLGDFIKIQNLIDGSETKVTQGTNVTITGNGTVATPYVINSTASAPDGSETKVTQGTNITITGNGTIATPYIVNGQYAPFERINEGNGNGYVIRGRNATYYGNIGLDAVDVSYSEATSSTLGATGESSFAQGVDVVASGYVAVVFGEDIDNNGTLSAVFGKGGVVTDGYGNFLTGSFNEVTSGANATVVGQFSELIANNIANVNDSTNIMFAVGNGTADGSGLPLTRSNAMVVKHSGLIEAPTATIAEIEAGDDKTLITKEYLETAIDNLQKVITYPTDFTGNNYTLTNADNNYEIIINNGGTAVTITVPSGLASKIGVGFTQKGTGEVSYIASGTTINNPIGLKIKGQFYQTYLSQEASTNIFFLGGNTKA